MENAFWFYGKILALLGTVALMVGFNFLTWGFHRSNRPTAPHLVGARPERGMALIKDYGCSACHAISGKSSRPRVGPSLEQLADQLYIAGTLANTPENLSLWIQNPQEFRPGTAMPNLNVGKADARDITAYLFDIPVNHATRAAKRQPE